MLLWSECYRVGIREIDEQHRELLDRYNSLYKTCLDSHSGKPEILVAFDRLSVFMQIHFSVEECLMRLVGYPQYRDHLRLHQDMRRNMKQERELFTRTGHGDSNRLLSRLYHCLIDHVQESDREYVSYLKARGFS